MKPLTTIVQLSDVAVTSVRFVKEIPRSVITTEERIRRRLQSAIHIALASAFIWIGAVLSIGIQATTSLAQTTVKAKTTRERRVKHKPKVLQSSTRLTGTASWYGRKFHKRKTASGKTFDKNAFMAAHRSLPFGTLVKVTNLSNDKSVIVEIADRGPYVGNRIIDVSRAAADALEFTSEGTATVQIDILSPELAALYNSHSKFISDALTNESSAIGSVVVSEQ